MTTARIPRTSPQTASDRYEAQQREAHTLLRGIAADLDQVGDGFDIDWGHVGSMAHLLERLGDAADVARQLAANTK